MSENNNLFFFMLIDLMWEENKQGRKGKIKRKLKYHVIHGSNAYEDPDVRKVTFRKARRESKS